MSEEKKIDCNRDYLIVSPNIKDGTGYHHMLSERAFLVHNLANFLNNHGDVTQENVTVYELKEINH